MQVHSPSCEVNFNIITFHAEGQSDECQQSQAELGQHLEG